MKYVNLFLIVLFLLPASGNAQMVLTIDKKAFVTEKSGSKEAWNHVRKGDSYYLDGGIWFSTALSEYQLAYAYNSENPVLNYKLGVACLFSDKKDEASVFFNKAFEAKNNVAPDILFLTGRSLMYNGRFSNAIEKFNSYLSSEEKKPKEKIAFTKKWIEECNAALVLTKDTLRIDIKNLGGNINSTADDYSEVLTSGGLKMLFASRRALSPRRNYYYDDTKFEENIFSSDYLNGEWTVSMLFNKNLITKFCETPLYLNEAGNQLYIYAGYQGDGDILVSELKRGKWKAPAQLNFKLNSKYPESSFTISEKGDEIAFISNHGKKGMGGKDIYLMKNISKSKNSKKGKWSKPVILGPSVNSSYDEESVRFSAGGDTLWFSSRGHNTIGGSDIFYSARSSEGFWGEAVNVGYPLNTAWDELFYYPSPSDDSLSFFVSNRGGGFGGLDIYSMRLLPPPPPEPVIIPEPVPVTVPPPKPEPVIIRDTVVIIKEVPKAVVPEPAKEFILYLVGKVTDTETKEPVLSRIEVFDFATDQVIATTASSDVDGTYRVRLQAKKSYMVNLRATGFLSDMKRVIIPDNFNEEFYTLDVSLVKMKVGKKVVLNNILFELGKAVLTTGSYAELDRLAGVLEDSPQMKIEISGHTDNTGSAVINAKLSTDRARAVVDYLVKKGIVVGRLSYMGYGSDQPISDNTTAAGRAKNRRVEFKIIGI